MSPERGGERRTDPSPRGSETWRPAAARALERDLRARIRGEVRFDAGSRALYSTDASNYRQVPIGVVIPADVDDVVETIEVARAHGAPVLPRGGGTSLAGQCCNVAVVIDLVPRVNRVLAMDPGRASVRVEPGCVLDALQRALRPHGLVFGPDPATHSRCTLGGMIGNNSCGVHSVTAGRTADNVESLEVVTYDGVRMRVGATPPDQLERKAAEPGRRGEIYAALALLRDRYAERIRARFPRIPRRVSGYNLDELLPENGFHVARALVGSEGTCVTVLEATLRVVPDPPHRSLLVLGFPDLYEAADRVPEILPFDPIGLEGMDDRLVEYLRLKGAHPEAAAMLPRGRGWLLVEFGGDLPREAHDRADRAARGLRGRPGAPELKVVDDRDQQRELWRVREAGLGVTAFVPGMNDTWEGWEDSAVPPHRLGAYLRDLRALLEAFGYQGAFYGHFGQGCIHTRIDFDLTSRGGIERYLDFTERAADLVVGYGGSLSGEHGDGQSRGTLLPRMFGEELMQAFREFKAIWDPGGMMNPGKLVDAAARDRNLRLGASYRPLPTTTHFALADDHGDFAHAALRCVGIGECRRQEGGTMCPSYRATGEEMHSTRGRARLLFEMLRGEVITRAWQSREVERALDLCLACKACKHECPVQVDMATYKAEFLAHHYRGRLRPRAAYVFGLISEWARIAAVAPGVANFVTHAPVVSALAKWAGGIAPERDVPRFAGRPFSRWFRERPGMDRGSARPGPFRPGPRVLLWPDTFNNFFHPETAIAAVGVLEHLGFEVVVPETTLCCGRPLYDFGMLDRARRRLREILAALRGEIERGTPVVVLEPSCLAVFRDEMAGLLPHDQDAKRLRELCITLAELVEPRLHERPLRLERPLLVHLHCHHRAVLGDHADRAVLEGMSDDVRVLDSGCCGMAGAFGFGRGEHYRVAMRCGELALLPAVRGAPPETLVLADGFSCREQIAQGAGRRARHLAEAMWLAIEPLARAEGSEIWDPPRPLAAGGRP